MIIGLFLAIPFVLTNDAMPEEGISLKVSRISITKWSKFPPQAFNFTTNETISNVPVWIGTIEPYKIAKEKFYDHSI